MARKPPVTVDPVRRLTALNPENGTTGICHNGIIYTRGMENQLPADFPQDGPHWEDWIPDETYDDELPAPDMTRDELDRADVARVKDAERRRLAMQGVANAGADDRGDTSLDATGPAVNHKASRGQNRR